MQSLGDGPLQSRLCLLHRVRQQVAASSLAADRLELEITEAVLIRDDDAALAILHQLRDIDTQNS